MGTTTPVWQIRPKQKKDWLKDHRADTQLSKKFNKFETTVTANPYPSPTNKNVKDLKGKLKGSIEYIADRRVRAIYSIYSSTTELDLTVFEWKSNIKYKRYSV